MIVGYTHFRIQIYGIAFHGTNSARARENFEPIDATANIYSEGFRNARIAAYGPGVYCSPDYQWLENSGYVPIHTIQTTEGPKRCKVMLQVAVDPNAVTKHCNNKIWVARNRAHIRPYRILIKQLE